MHGGGTSITARFFLNGNQVHITNDRVVAVVGNEIRQRVHLFNVLPYGVGATFLVQGMVVDELIEFFLWMYHSHLKDIWKPLPYVRNQE
jgi:hypothetical protein